MYARITPYKMKPGSQAAAVAIMNALKDKIMALPGQHSFLNVSNDGDGTGYVISTTEIADQAPETAEKIKALWGAFSEHLVEQPTAHTYDWRA